MAKFIKNPIVIEATQWFNNGDHPEDGDEVFEEGEFKGEKLEGKVVRYYRRPECEEDACVNCDHAWLNHGWIDTPQGGHIVCPGDWIIKEEFAKYGYYPCKPDSFKKTYTELQECP